MASNVPGLKNLVYGAGVLFQYKDEIALAHEVNRLLEDKKYRDNVIAACKKRVEQYRLDKMIASHVELYTEICQK